MLYMFNYLYTCMGYFGNGVSSISCMGILGLQRRTGTEGYVEEVGIHWGSLVIRQKNSDI